MKKTGDQLSISISMIIMMVIRRRVMALPCATDRPSGCQTAAKRKHTIPPLGEMKLSSLHSTPIKFFFFTSAAMIYYMTQYDSQQLSRSTTPSVFFFSMLKLLLLPKARRALACVWSAKKKVHSQHARHHEPPFIHHCLFPPKICVLPLLTIYTC